MYPCWSFAPNSLSEETKILWETIIGEDNNSWYVQCIIQMSSWWLWMKYLHRYNYDWFFRAVWGSSLPTHSNVEKSFCSWFLPLFSTLSWLWVYPYRYCWRMCVLSTDSPTHELGLTSVFIYKDGWESVFPFNKYFRGLKVSLQWDKN